MKRRDTLKTLVVGTVVTGALVTAPSACNKVESESISTSPDTLYGRTPEEIEHDKKVMAKEGLGAHEMATLRVLCDIILPATSDRRSAVDAEVPEFIDFMIKDIESLHIPVRGGLMWINAEAMRRYQTDFVASTKNQQIAIIEDIAYPENEALKKQYSQGVKAFNLLRNLTLTGYYTTREGIEEIGYVGNRANVWDGVPQSVLDKHDVDYEPEWLAKCVDQSKRAEIAEWDDDGNLLT